MPITKYFNIKIDSECGEAEVIFTNDFHKKGPLWRADILQDIINNLREEYDDAVEDMGSLYSCHSKTTETSQPYKKH